MDPETAAGRRLVLTAEAETAALGARLARTLSPGDVVTLRGQLGAGKSVLARAIIRTLLGEPEAAIPSPSYTLINVYETPAGDVWHADLYRLGGAEEALELGLLDAIDEAILIVEWPDRLGPYLPARRLDLTLAPQRGGGGAGAEPRALDVAPRGGGWEQALDAIGREA